MQFEFSFLEHSWQSFLVFGLATSWDDEVLEDIPSGEFDLDVVTFGFAAVTIWVVDFTASWRASTFGTSWSGAFTTSTWSLTSRRCFWSLRSSIWLDWTSCTSWFLRNYSSSGIASTSLSWSLGISSGAQCRGARPERRGIIIPRLSPTTAMPSSSFILLALFVNWCYRVEVAHLNDHLVAILNLVWVNTFTLEALIAFNFIAITNQ